jgi:hypothetical protein
MWPFIFVRPDAPFTIQEIIKHEKIHARQQLEMAWIFFFIWYILEFLIRLVVCRNFMKAYQHLSHEKEAYANEDNPEYLKRRRFWEFLRYL